MASQAHFSVSQCAWALVVVVALLGHLSVALAASEPSAPNVRKRTNEPPASGAQQVASGPQASGAQHAKQVHKCSKQSIILARQAIAHELSQMSRLSSLWFNDLDQRELVDGQRQSLTNIVMSGLGARLLHPGGQPLIELDSSYFRAGPATAGAPADSLKSYNQPQSQQHQQQLGVRLVRGHHQDRCYLNADKGQFTLVLALVVGPVRHHLDLVYNLPKDLSLGQPQEWRYAQVSVQVPKMVYELSVRQAANHRLSDAKCALELLDLMYVPPARLSGADQTGAGAARSLAGLGVGGAVNTNKPRMSVTSSGLALNNQTLLQIERLFDDYTRPTITRRLREMLSFYLNSKSLPLVVATTPLASPTITITPATQ